MMSQSIESPPPSYPRADLRLTLIVFALCIFAFMWGSLYYRLQQAQAEAMQNATTDASNLVRSLAEYSERLLQTADQTTLLIAQAYREQGMQLDLAAYRRLGVLGDRAFAGMALTNAAGQVILSTTPSKQVEVASSDFFIAAQAHTGLVISKPQTDQLSGREVLQLARRLQDEKGQFIGVAYVALDLTYMNRFLMDLVLGSHGAITLAGSDGVVRARTTGDIPVRAKERQQSIAKGMLYPILLKEGNGVTISRSLLDGRSRFNAFRKLGEYPLYAIVGIDTEDALQAFESHKRQSLQLLVVVSILILSAFVVIWMLIKRLFASRQEAYQLIQKQTSLLDDLAVQQAALRETSDRMAAILHNAADAIITTNQERMIESVNPAAERLFGYRHDELLGKHADILAPTHVHGVIPSLLAGEEFFRTGKIHIESERIRRDGVVFPVDFSISEFRVGGQRKLMSIIRDISERRKMERLKSAFVASVSYELRTPLTAIHGGLGLIKGQVFGRLPEKAQELVIIAHKNTERLSKLIDDLLDVQKLEVSIMEFVESHYQLHALLQQAIASMQAESEQRSVRIVLAGEVPDVWLWIDGQRFLQVIGNLLSNACKFSKANSNVSVQAHLISSQRVRIAVIDRGVGIASEFQPFLFEKFSQINGAALGEQHGTGLGLAIAKAIVQRMGGEINFQSTRGQGSTFFVELPTVAAGEVAVLTGQTGAHS